MFEDLTILGLLSKGGVTVIILGVLSVISIAIMLERAFAFRRFSSELNGSKDGLYGALREGGAEAARAVCSSVDTPLSRVLLSGLSRKGRPREEISSAMELAGKAEISRLERFLGALGTIGSTAPFIGLFGTVIGIIRAFSDLAVAEGASPSAVADGIAEALVATATGLFVAVPAVMAYNYFVRRASKCALDIEVAASGFTDALAGEATDGLEPQG